MSSKDRLAQLRAARAQGGRAKQWKATEEEDIFDVVDEDKYKNIVKGRLARDDFIEDDDGSGYVDNGMDDWDNEVEQENSEEDQDQPKRRKSKKSAKTKVKASESLGAYFARSASKPAAAAAAAPSVNPYRKEVSSEKADDFLSSLLSNLDDPSAPAAPPTIKKPPTSSYRSYRSAASASGSGYSTGLSSDPPEHPSSDDSFASRARRKLDLGALSSPAKKLRLSEATVRAADEPISDGGLEFDFGDAMTMDEPVKKEEEDAEDEADGFSVRAPLRAATTGPRPRVNAVSSKAVKPAPPPAVKKESPPPPGNAGLSLALPSAAPSPTKPKAEPPRAWLAIHESLQASPSLSPKAAEAATPYERAGSPTDSPIYQDDGSVHLYWFDYLEDAGKVILFGKVFDPERKKWTSASVTVDGIERNLFVLPRPYALDDSGNETSEPPERGEIHAEFDGLRQKAKIKTWAAKFVNRKYAFEEKGVPQGESEWLKVVYSFDQPQIPLGASGKTFSLVFGTNTSPFELLVLKRKIMGPCWLKIEEADVHLKGSTWCKHQFIVREPKNVNPFAETDAEAPKDAPPLTIMSLSARSIVNHQNNNREVVCATARTWTDVNLEDPTPPEKQPSSSHTVVRPLGMFPPGFEMKARQERSKIEPARNEKNLLSNLLAIVQKHDPDVIIGHDLLGDTLDVILTRMADHKISNWSRIGRVRRDKWPRTKFGRNKLILTGRLICDLSSDNAKGMIASTTWSLTEMCGTHLKIQREDIDPDDTAGFFDHYATSPDRLLHFVKHCEIDTFFQMAIVSKVQILPLTRQLTNLAGNSWGRTLTGGRAERNEYILLHEFHRQKYVCPDKLNKWDKKAAAAEAAAERGEDGGGKKGGKKDKYKGGLVFEPKRGLWDKFILVMDFNSLYPSIIQEFNIDFTTVDRLDEQDGDGEEKMPDVPSSDIKQGVLPRLIATLVNRRRQVKGLMKDKKATPAQLLQLDIRQKALKLTANSMYGCLGFEGSRFYARPLAALTTFKGREILTHTRELAESMQLDVVYGDTDSVFVNSNELNYDEALKVANEFKKHVNERYKLLEIDLDGVFQRLLLLQKKKYAAVKVEEDGSISTEVKGLDMKRREYSVLSKNVSNYVLQQILSGEATETVVERIHEYLRTVGEDVRGGKIPLDDFIINKRLGKQPEDYPDAKSQPHVQVALRLKAKGGHARAGDVIPYVFCLGEDGQTSKTAKADNAYHPDDLRRKDSQLKIDFEQYLSLQVLPPVERLCESIDGTDRARLAECLGLDPTRFQTSSGTHDVEREFHTLQSQLSDKERFREATPFALRCRSCDVTLAFGGLSNDATGVIKPSGLACPACSSPYALGSVATQLELQIRAHIAKYYDGMLVCDDPSCGNRSRMMSVYGRRCLANGCRGSMRYEYDDQKLYNQLLFFRTLFDTNRAISSAAGTARFDEVSALAEQNRPVLTQLYRTVQRFMDKNGRGFVPLADLFQFMITS